MSKILRYPKYLLGNGISKAFAFAVEFEKQEIVAKILESFRIEELYLTAVKTFDLPVLNKLFEIADANQSLQDVIKKYKFAKEGRCVEIMRQTFSEIVENFEGKMPQEQIDKIAED